MNNAQTRIIDPILSGHARGFIRPGNVGMFLFPVVDVPAYGGQVIEFDKASFRIHNSRRAPGSDVKFVEMGYAGKPYAVVPHALNAKVPRELMTDASQVPGIDLAADAIDVVMSSLELEREYDSAQLARDPANYDTDHKVALTGADRWLGATSDPSKDIAVAREAVRASIGVRPNIVILSATAFNAATEHPKIFDRTKYTSSDSITEEILAKLWKVKKVVVAEAVVAAENGDSFGDVWGDDVIVAYVAQGQSNGRRNKAEPSYGYCYAIQGMPIVENPRWDAGKLSWVYGVSNDGTPVLAGMSAGYLIQDAGGDPS
jgi:hypothetical protein